MQYSNKTRATSPGPGPIVYVIILLLLLLLLRCVRRLRSTTYVRVRRTLYAIIMYIYIYIYSILYIYTKTHSTYILTRVGVNVAVLLLMLPVLWVTRPLERQNLTSSINQRREGRRGREVAARPLTAPPTYRTDRLPPWLTAPPLDLHSWRLAPLPLPNPLPRRAQTGSAFSASACRAGQCGQ